VVITDQNSTPRTFLVNATERLFDERGNDNGLCESDESCVYSPNIGAYQGMAIPRPVASLRMASSLESGCTHCLKTVVENAACAGLTGLWKSCEFS